MAENHIDLGSQRLILSQNLGDKFVQAIESLPSSEDPPMVRAVRQRLFNNPNIKLLGYDVKEGEGLKAIEESLCKQMGLPPGSSLRDVRDRLIGREKEFLLVVSGLDSLPLPNQKGIKDRLRKSLSIENVW